MRFVLAFLTIFMLNLGYMQIPQPIYFGLILGYGFFSLVFFIKDKNQLNFILRNNLIFFIFFIIIISYLKTNNPNTSIRVVMLDILNWIFCFFYFSNFILFSIKKGFNPFILVAYSIIVFIILNLLVSLVYNRNESSIENLIFKLITGITINKQIFSIGPLSANHSAIFIAMLSPFILLVKKKKVKWLSILATFIALILLDNRMSILSIILSVSLFFSLNKVKLSFVTKIIAIIIPSFVMILMVVLPLLAFTSDLEMFSRNSEEIMTANSRTLIWASIIEVISTLNMQTFFGSGDYGNLVHSTSSDYLSLFVNFEDSSVKSSHNTYLQIILDKGYFTLLLFYVFLLKFLNKLFKMKNEKNTQLFIISVIIFLLSGTTEVLFGSYYFPITFYLLVMAVYINNKKNNIYEN